MSIQQYKSTLAHELGHAYYQDEPAINGHFHARQERKADEFAANLLLDHDDVQSAMVWNNNHLGATAIELEVTVHILKTWLNMERKNSKHELPRMG